MERNTSNENYSKKDLFISEAVLEILELILRSSPSDETSLGISIKATKSLYGKQNKVWFYVKGLPKDSKLIALLEALGGVQKESHLCLQHTAQQQLGTQLCNGQSQYATSLSEQPLTQMLSVEYSQTGGTGNVGTLQQNLVLDHGGGLVVQTETFKSKSMDGTVIYLRTDTMQMFEEGKKIHNFLSLVRIFRPQVIQSGHESLKTNHDPVTSGPRLLDVSGITPGFGQLPSLEVQLMTVAQYFPLQTPKTSCCKLTVFGPNLLPVDKHSTSRLLSHHSGVQLEGVRTHPQAFLLPICLVLQTTTGSTHEVETVCRHSGRILSGHSSAIRQSVENVLEKILKPVQAKFKVSDSVDLRSSLEDTLRKLSQSRHGAAWHRTQTSHQSHSHQTTERQGENSGWGDDGVFPCYDVGKKSKSEETMLGSQISNSKDGCANLQECGK
ncbi:hypothetical protein MAR_002413, partial [Mya arenaria]